MSLRKELTDLVSCVLGIYQDGVAPQVGCFFPFKTQDFFLDYHIGMKNHDFCRHWKPMCLRSCCCLRSATS